MRKMLHHIGKTLATRSKSRSVNALNKPLKSKDPEIYRLIQQEKIRQTIGLELIASENFTSKAVMECLGSVATNKYSEGQPYNRYYGGNEYIDQIESLCKQRALYAFNLDNDEWDVNAQPYSGSIANLAAYHALLKVHDRIMGLGLESGGHLTHGYYTSKKKISASSIFYESFPYHVKADGYIDYDILEQDALRFMPKLIICGASAYPRDFDYSYLRKIADSVGAYLLADISHIGGLVATGEHNNPFQYCDLVTTTTHKTLRGPRAAMIFYRLPFKNVVDFAVFPGLQGGPHNNQIAAIATQLKEVASPEFKLYIKQVKNNTQALCKRLIDLDYKLTTNGSDNHLVLINLNNLNVSGSKVEKLCELADISLNKKYRLLYLTS